MTMIKQNVFKHITEREWAHIKNDQDDHHTDTPTMCIDPFEDASCSDGTRMKIGTVVCASECDNGWHRDIVASNSVQFKGS